MTNRDLDNDQSKELNNENGNNNQANDRNNDSIIPVVPAEETTATATRDLLPPNEPLIAGFSLLRACQLLNIDIYYICFSFISSEAARLFRLNELNEAARLQSEAAYFAIDGGDEAEAPYYVTFLDECANSNPIQKFIDRHRILDKFCKFLKIFSSLLALTLCSAKTISNLFLCLATRILLNTHFSSSSSTNTNIHNQSSDATTTSHQQKLVSEGEDATNTNMSLFALVVVNISSLFILYSTIFNGHLVWNLFSRRLFLVSKRFQQTTMLMLLGFIYVEYIINISFVNNLYEWNYSSSDIRSDHYAYWSRLKIFATEKDEDNELIDLVLTIIQFARGIIRISPYICVNYAIICLIEHIETIRKQVLLTESLKKRSKLRLAVTSRKRNHPQVNNIKSTVNSITKTIDNSENNSSTNNKQITSSAGPSTQAPEGAVLNAGANAGSPKKRVYFGIGHTNLINIPNNNSTNENNELASFSDHLARVALSQQLEVVDRWAQAQCENSKEFNERKSEFITEINANDTRTLTGEFSGSSPSTDHQILTSKQVATSPSADPLIPRTRARAVPSTVTSLSASSLDQEMSIKTSYYGNNNRFSNNHPSLSLSTHHHHHHHYHHEASQNNDNSRKHKLRKVYLDRIKNFDQLESYITNLYIFTGRLNRVMSSQGLGIFFIIHNLVISASLVKPEAIHGGPFVQYFIQFLMITLALVPFINGESLNRKLEQLSKQIDRIIIQQQLTHHKRDNLIRIRDLIHDIKVNCGGMLNFNVQGGIKYLIIAFACAFFIEQEGKLIDRQ